jgi:hypothetical protein
LSAAESVSPETYRQNPSAYRPFRDKYGKIKDMMEKDRYGRGEQQGDGWLTDIALGTLGAVAAVAMPWGGGEEVDGLSAEGLDAHD